MARWEPNARGRLEQAALELFSDQGFDRATVGEIAARAGLVPRTFFRHFADKREVLFWGYDALADHLQHAILVAPPMMSPIAAVAAALEVAATEFPDRPEFSRRRRDLFAATPELQERELLKLAALATAIGNALSKRGVPEPSARLTAEIGIAVFKTAYEAWITRSDARGYAEYVRETFTRLREITDDGVSPKVE